MGSRSTVYGFIELDPRLSQFNKTVFEEFQYDETYPFPDIFGPERTGFESSVVSFAGSLKSLIEDWDEWESQFDRLLSLLSARSAIVRLDDDIEGEFIVIHYVCNDGWDTGIQPPQTKLE
ncbi:hypothetical protein Pan153_02320 [Gimesia panareensis]|uniref:Uncharacterized protein n=1 Tax=Gimesia panareensis TaxID=2527978 RepID=A0A518FGZ8_9PLAN|nr:hypothetical protein [Gimesia panareensis]QDV15616.1 hypothetical protein Pan153_02320 [Gimesia panareensis]